jgi:carboxymethylenebutenolidase
VNIFRMTMAAAFLFAATASHAAEIKVMRTLFTSGGKQVAAEKFASATSPRRTILVLHGAGGTLLDGPEMRRMSQSLAAAGNTVYLIHYFNRTGTLVALDSTMQKHFVTWLATVKDAVAWAREDSASHHRVGIYGYSLGAFLAVFAASDNSNVGAVVEQAGGVWNGKEHFIGKMPAVLVVHGRADQRVPFPKYAEPLVRLLRERHALGGTVFFPGEAHGFTAATNAVVRTKAADFFQRQL